MDIFHEQLVKIRTTPIVTVSRILVWLAAILVAAACCFFAFSITPLLIFVAVAAIYAGVKVNGLLNIEFEYIVTNGSVDIDKIVNKSDRKRIVCFDCGTIESIKKYSGEKEEGIKQYICTDSEGITVVVSPSHGERCAVSFSPDKSLIDAMKPFISRAVLREYGEA